MAKQKLKIEIPFQTTIITRTDLARWYGITDRGLRKRIKKADICIKNRILTLNDLQTIIHKLGIPSMIPSEWIELFELTIRST